MTAQWQTVYQLPDEHLPVYVISHHGRVFYCSSDRFARPGLRVVVWHGPEPTDHPVPPSGWSVAATATEAEAS